MERKPEKETIEEANMKVSNLSLLDLRGKAISMGLNPQSPMWSKIY